jgi:TonB family protein
MVLVFFGCASASSPAPVPVGPEAHDAGPRFLRADQVDVPARPLSPIEPAYPPRLRALGVEGEVEVQVAVRADGSVGAARWGESTHPDFTEAVRAAVREARFEPARRGGELVGSWVSLRLRFRLDDGP